MNEFDFLTEYITAKVVEQISNDMKVDLEAALVMFHNSETFEILNRKSTDMYIESPAYVYEIFCEELRRGTIRGMTE